MVREACFCTFSQEYSVCEPTKLTQISQKFEVQTLNTALLSFAGFCLPEDAQKEWDRLNGAEAALADVSDDEAQSSMVGGAEGSSDEGTQGTFYFVTDLHFW